MSRATRRPASRVRVRPTRAFSLIEAVAVVVIVALVVPPIASTLTSSAQSRVDQISLVRASTLGDAVLESIVADCVPDDEAIGFAALAAPATYLDDPDNGLYARLSDTAETYDRYGISYRVVIGPLSDADGVVTGEAEQDRYRRVSVVVSYPSREGLAEIAFVSVVGDL